MKTFKTLVLLFAVVIGSISVANAQFRNGEEGPYFAINFIGAMPIGDFSGESASIPMLGIKGPSTMLFGQSNGNASMGAGFGLKFDYSIAYGISAYISVDAMWNQLNADMRSSYDLVSKTKPNYINFPVMLGVGYQCFFGRVFGLYANAGAGVGMMYLTPEGWSDELTHFRLSTAFSWQAGGGIMLGEHISLGAHYYMLGNHKIDAKDSLIPVPVRHQKMGILAFKLGIIF